MSTIIQYRPNFFTGFDTEVVEFNTNKELLSIPFVKSFTKHKTFIQFLIYDYCEESSDSRYLIMAEYKGKKENERWGVGFFDDIGNLDLEKGIDNWQGEAFFFKKT